MVSFMQVFPTRPCLRLSFPAICPANLVHLDLITQCYSVRSTDHNGLLYAVLSGTVSRLPG